MFPYGETVTRLRAPLVVGPYSTRPEPDWSVPPAELDIPGCGVAEGGSTEPLDATRNAVVSDFDVFLPAGTDVTARDRLRVRGLVCQVVGRPFDWRSPFTAWAAGTVAHCNVVEG